MKKTIVIRAVSFLIGLSGLAGALSAQVTLNRNPSRAVGQPQLAVNTRNPNLVEGREATVESPTGKFDPFVVHYAETFIVPAAVGAYTIRPGRESEGSKCGTIKAFVRSR